LELRQITTFVAVVQHGTLNAAATALDYSQSAVTLHIQQLERALGAPLFDRIGKSVVLTPLGRRVHARALQILSAIDELKRDALAMSSGEAGHVRVGVIEPTASMRLPAILSTMRKARPGIDVSVEVGGSVTMTSRVASGALDFAVTTPPEPESSLQFEHLFEERMVVIVPRKGSADSTRLTAKHLSNQGVVLTEHGCAYRQAIGAAFAKRGAHLSVRLEMGSIPAIIECVRKGLGPGIIPAAALPAVERALVARTIADIPLHIPVGITSRKQMAEPSRVVQIVRNHFRANLAAKEVSKSAVSPERKAASLAYNRGARGSSCSS
jgi:DNA-binding transcriptional LysR family regulator